MERLKIKWPAGIWGNFWGGLLVLVVWSIGTAAWAWTQTQGPKTWRATAVYLAQPTQLPLWALFMYIGLALGVISFAGLRVVAELRLMRNPAAVQNTPVAGMPLLGVEGDPPVAGPVPISRDGFGALAPGSYPSAPGQAAAPPKFPSLSSDEERILARLGAKGSDGTSKFFSLLRAAALDRLEFDVAFKSLEEKRLVFGSEWDDRVGLTDEGKRLVVSRRRAEETKLL